MIHTLYTTDYDITQVFFEGCLVYLDAQLRLTRTKTRDVGFGPIGHTIRCPNLDDLRLIVQVVDDIDPTLLDKLFVLHGTEKYPQPRPEVKAV